MMDELCANFKRLGVYNPTAFHLYVGAGGGVFTGQQLLAHTCIGELEGAPAFLQDIDHEEYFEVDDEYVLDVSSNDPRSILTFVRQYEDMANCAIQMDVNESTRETRFFLWTTKRIDVDEELVCR